MAKTGNHPNAGLAELRLSDVMIESLRSGMMDNALLCELAALGEGARSRLLIDRCIDRVQVDLNPST